MKTIYITLILSIVASCGIKLSAAEKADTSLVNASPSAMNKETRTPIERKNKIKEQKHQLVRVGNDTVSMVIPEKNYGRFDRGLFNYLYIPKGKWSIGLTASYGELNTDEVQILSVLDNVNFKGHIYSIRPSISYFFRNNQSIGLRINFTRGSAELESLDLDIDDDINFSLRDVNYFSQHYKIGAVYRSYVGLNDKKLFSVFNEVALEFGSGSSRFKRHYNDELFDTRTTSIGASLNFSPGVCVFLQDYVAFNISFGVFGVNLNKEKQTTNGVNEGSRFSSGANFKFNIFNINFGMLVVI